MNDAAACPCLVLVVDGESVVLGLSDLVDGDLELNASHAIEACAFVAAVEGPGGARELALRWAKKNARYAARMLRGALAHGSFIDAGYALDAALEARAWRKVARAYNPAPVVVELRRAA